MLFRICTQRVLIAGCLSLWLGGGLRAEPAAERPLSERLLPANTKGFLSVANVDRLRADWDKTQLGQLMADPIMQPFVEDFRRQLQHKWNQSHRKLGISWEDLEGVPSGEVAFAVIQPQKNQAAFALVVDVAGRQQQTNALLEKIAANLAADRARRSVVDVHGMRVTVFDIPKREDHPARQAMFCVRDEVLVAADNLRVIEGILGRFSGAGKDSLAALPAFEAVMARCHTAAGELEPHARWFLEPFGYAEALRASSPDRHRKGTDMLKILQHQGFTAVQGAGGFVNLAVGQFELLHRTAVFAPAVKHGENRYELAANILDFPNGGDFLPHPWVPREVASYASFNLKPKKAFEASKTLVNEIVGDEVFDDVIQSILTDPDGPQIDLRRDLIAYLGQRAVILTDYLLPITPKSERMLFGLETNNPTALAATIEKSMKTDPSAKRHEFNGQVIWEVINEESDLPMVTIENHPAFGPNAADEQPERERMIPNSAVTVAFGHLLVATHYDFLTKVLSANAQNELLVQSPEYRMVKADLDQLAGPDVCAQTFSRTDEEYRAVYELIRTGRMPEAETLLGKLLNAALGEGKEGIPRSQRIDGGKLPDYEAIRRYFGPAGLSVTSEDNGWFVTGFTVGKDAP